MKLVPDNDGSGNVVVRYPGRQEVDSEEPGRHLLPPFGRRSRTHRRHPVLETSRRSGTTYQFSLGGRLTRSPISARSVVLSYDTGRQADQGAGLEQPDQHRRTGTVFHLDR